MKNIFVLTVLCLTLSIAASGHVIDNDEVTGSDNIDDTITYNDTEIETDTHFDENIDNHTDIHTDSSEESNSTSAEITPENRVFRMRERYRKFRLRRIRQQILRSLGWTDTPVIPEELRLHYMEGRIEGPIFTEDRRCFSASCSLPRQIDDHLWTDEELGGFRVYTNISPRNYVSESNLHSAELKVYLTHVEGLTCHGDVVPISQTGSRFLVSVYQFIRPLRIQRSRNRILNRKRLLDARMITTSGHMWVAFDVKQAVREWASGGRGNFGFEITVRDENETDCNAMGMFVPVDCNTPEETGCPENPSGPLHLSPWSEQCLDDNSPYLEIVTRNRVRHIHRRARRSVSSRPTGSDVTHRSRHDMTTWLRHGTCHGRRETVNLIEIDDKIIAPTQIETLRCGGMCASTSEDFQQIVTSPCRPTETRPVYGIYFDDSDERNVIIGQVYDKVVQCGC